MLKIRDSKPAAASSEQFPGLLRRPLLAAARALGLGSVLVLELGCRNLATTPVPANSMASASPAPIGASSAVAGSPSVSAQSPSSSAAAAERPATPPSSAAAQRDGARFESHGLTLIVSADDVTIIRSGQVEPLFSIRTFEAARFRQDFPISSAPGQPDSQRCARRVTIMPIAWTGQLLSVRQLEETGCTLESHPAGEARFITWLIDPTKPDATRAASLSDWYTEAELLAALNRDRLVRRNVSSPSQRSLAELLQSLADAAPVISSRYCYAFPSDLLARFAPSHLQGEDLSVRLSLPGAAVCRNQLTELGILLPLPGKWRAGLEDAALGHNGFLKGNVSAALAQHPCVIELGPIPFAEAHP